MLKRYRKYGRRKRWHFNASANLPIIGKTSIALGSRKARAQKRSMYKIAKAVVRKSVAPKRFIETITNVNPTNNTVYTLNLLDVITKGTDDENRLGEHIWLKNYMASMQWLGHLNDQNLDYMLPKFARILVIKTRDEYNTNGAFQAGIGASALFENNDTALFMVSPILKENVSVLYDSTIQVSTGANDRLTQMKNVKFNVPLDFGFTYEDGSVYGKTWNLYLVVVTHVPTIASSATLSGNFSIGSHINFSDTK